MPLHVWMPLAHAAAPMPASAVLSGVVVKAGIIGLIRFLPVDAALADWGNTLALVGMFTALYAVAIGITQSHPKVVLAYSSVSQMGFTAAVIGMGIANLDTATPVLAAFYATPSHTGQGRDVPAGRRGGGDRRHASARYAAARRVLALGLGGLPLTGGAVAKLAVKGPLGGGWAETVGYASAIGTTLLMLHFLRRVANYHATAPDARAASGLRWPWLVTAVAAIVVPWVLYLVLSLGAVAEILAPKALWASLWPVAVGAGLAWLLARAGDRLPRVPPGDIACVIDFAAPSAARVSLGLGASTAHYGSGPWQVFRC